MTQIGLDSFSYNLTIEDPGHPLDVFWFLNRVVELGLDGCQVDPRHTQGWSHEVVRGIGDFCSSHGLYLELGAWRYDPEVLASKLETCAEVGARCLRTFYGGLRHRMTPEEIQTGVSESIEGLKRLSGVAERVRVPLALENHEEFTSEEIVEIIQAVSSPFVGVCLDTGNGMMVGEDPLDCVRRLSPCAVCLHLKDWVVHWNDGVPRWEDRPLGEGEGKALEVIGLLRQNQPDIPLTIEVPTWGSCRPVTTADEDRNVVRSIEFARRVVGGS